MKNTLLLSVALLLFSAGVPVAAPDVTVAPEVPADEVVLSGSKKDVPFSHLYHDSLACTVCHHLVNGKKQFAKCSTFGCHDDLMGRREMRSLYYVVHAQGNLRHQTCMSCHIRAAEKAPDRKKELTGCSSSGCHP